MEMSVAEFADRLNEVMPVVIKEFARRQAKELYTGKITLPQFLILDYLVKNDAAKMSDLARFMQVSTAAATGIVERLVRDKYVLRQSEPKDRRVIKIKITTKGMELVRKVNQQRRQMIIKIFGTLSAAQRRAYLQILGQIRSALINQAPFMK